MAIIPQNERYKQSKPRYSNIVQNTLCIFVYYVDIHIIQIVVLLYQQQSNTKGQRVESMRKTYKETKAAVKELVVNTGLKNILCKHLVELYEQGHNVTNVQNALSYFTYSPQAAKYR